MPYSVLEPKLNANNEPKSVDDYAHDFRHIKCVRVNDPNGIDTLSGLPLLHTAAKHGILNAVCALIHCEVNLLAIDSEKKTPIHHAAENGHFEIVKAFLMEKDYYEQYYPKHKSCTPVPRDAQDNLKRTALHYAASHGFYEIVQILLEKYSSIDLTDQDELTPLELVLSNPCLKDEAKKRDSEKVVALLINECKKKTKRKVDHQLDSTDRTKTGTGNNYLHLAVLAVKNKFSIDFVDKNIIYYTRERHIEQPNHEGLTPLQFAAKHGDVGIFKWLIGHNADLRRRDKDGNGLLQLAVIGKNYDLALHILNNLYRTDDARASAVNRQNNKGETLLHLAVANKNCDVFVDNLVNAYGANFDIPDREGATPLQKAQANGYDYVIVKYGNSAKSDVGYAVSDRSADRGEATASASAKDASVIRHRFLRKLHHSAVSSDSAHNVSVLKESRDTDATDAVTHLAVGGNTNKKTDEYISRETVATENKLSIGKFLNSAKSLGGKILSSTGQFIKNHRIAIGITLFLTIGVAICVLCPPAAGGFAIAGFIAGYIGCSAIVVQTSAIVLPTATFSLAFAGKKLYSWVNDKINARKIARMRSYDDDRALLTSNNTISRRNSDSDLKLNRSIVPRQSIEASNNNENPVLAWCRRKASEVQAKVINVAAAVGASISDVLSSDDGISVDISGPMSFSHPGDDNNPVMIPQPTPAVYGTGGVVPARAPSRDPSDKDVDAKCLSHPPYPPSGYNPYTCTFTDPEKYKQAGGTRHSVFVVGSRDDTSGMDTGQSGDSDKKTRPRSSSITSASPTKDSKSSMSTQAKI